MTILSTSTQAHIRRYMIAQAAYVAFEHECEIDDVWAAIGRVPAGSHDPFGIRDMPYEPQRGPGTLDTAAQTDRACPAVPTSPAGDDVVASPATPEPLGCEPSDPLRSGAATREDADTAAPAQSPIPQHDAADDADDVTPKAPSSASDITENAADTPQAEDGPTTTSSAPNQDRPIPQHAPLSADPVASEALPGPDATGEAEPSVSPVPLTKKEQVGLCHEAHPDWSSVEIAEHLGLSKGSISGHLHHLGIKLPRKDVATRFKPSQEARQPAPTPPQPAPVKTPPVIIPAPTGTLTDRVRYLHQLHPTWTATMISNELGVKATSVSTILGLIRGENRKPAERQFGSEREMLQHYGDVGKRLGKV